LPEWYVKHGTRLFRQLAFLSIIGEYGEKE